MGNKVFTPSSPLFLLCVSIPPCHGSSVGGGFKILYVLGLLKLKIKVVTAIIVFASAGGKSKFKSSANMDIPITNIPNAVIAVAASGFFCLKESQNLARTTFI